VALWVGTGEGLEGWHAQLRTLAEGDGEAREGDFTARARQVDALRRARAGVGAARAQLDHGMLELSAECGDKYTIFEWHSPFGFSNGVAAAEAFIGSHNDPPVPYGWVGEARFTPMTDTVATRVMTLAATHAGTTITGNAAGMKSTAVAARKLPSDTAFDYYLARGTFIDVASLPTSNGAKRIGEAVLGPGVNPYGLANPEGIYVLDCKNQKLTISDSRILGTLVILEPGTDSSIADLVSIAPAISNYPSLLVRGNIKFTYQSDSFFDYVSGSRIGSLGYGTGQFKIP